MVNASFISLGLRSLMAIKSVYNYFNCLGSAGTAGVEPEVKKVNLQLSMKNNILQDIKTTTLQRLF